LHFNTITSFNGGASKLGVKAKQVEKAHRASGWINESCIAISKPTIQAKGETGETLSTNPRQQIFLRLRDPSMLHKCKFPLK
jgi:hypothetical protein